MSASPLFSVVIPVFNKGPYVSRAIHSVLAQTQCDFELLAVCEPSSDHSTREVERFTDPRLRVFHRSAPGPGGYAARNLGIENARAPWIAFLDADDLWLPDHLRRLTALIHAFPSQKILSSGWLLQSKTSLPDRYSQLHHDEPSHVIDLKDYLRSEARSARPIWTGVACIQRELLLAAGLFPAGKLARSGDLDTWFRCIFDAGSMAWSAHIGAIYDFDTIHQVTRRDGVDLRQHQISIGDALSRTQNVDIRRLLHERENNLVINAWVSNLYVSGAPCFAIVRQLNWRHPLAHQLKCLAYGAASLLPKPIARFVHQSLARARLHTICSWEASHALCNFIRQRVSR